MNFQRGRAGLIDRLVCTTRDTRVPLFIHSTFYIYIYVYILSTWPPTDQPPDQYFPNRYNCPTLPGNANSTAAGWNTSYWVRHRATFLPSPVNKPCIMTLKRVEILNAGPPTPWPSSPLLATWQAPRLLSRNNFGAEPKSYFFVELLASFRRRRRR